MERGCAYSPRYLEQRQENWGVHHENTTTQVEPDEGFIITDLIRLLSCRFDEGEILRSAACDIQHNETAASLTRRLSVLGAEELRQCLADLPGCLANSKPQPIEGITYGVYVLYP